ncbi:cytochrome c3 family protein [Turicimonas muris]|uniref:cytochrome c3 family protein n=1 Tax=Turicimonas muris TaxID=1796652 RepID=UPI002494A375|nr:cytochrome c3 family protein [Turicimonas muris]
MKKILLAAAVLMSFGVTSVSAQMSSMSKHSARGVQCTVCHQGTEFKPVPTSQCVTCHNQDALASKTDRLNFISKMKNPKTGEVKEHKALINPHNSYHFGKTEDCSDCHREHRASVNDCGTCHDVKAWGMKDPK